MHRLGKLVRRLPAKLNLIPFNPVPGQLPFESPPRERVLTLRDRLLAEHVPVSVRFSQGPEALAACGQLFLGDL
jgi:23S rRNA (adenine2503-C2)-methyltransferase